MATMKEKIAQQAYVEQCRAEKEQDRVERETILHHEKINKSTTMFKNTKITSCSSILSKNGQAVCLAFTNGAPKPIDLNTKRSSETCSLSAQQF